ncbi:MAG: DUF4290 domain-containing protein [Flavobacteriales bacterium]|nr:DUF4290 domain-containing protein [Flavobacteriales bacterium]
MENETPFLPYNSERPDLIIPEYGRNIQQMVDFAVTVEDREERNKVVGAIISVMGQLFPYLRDIEDFKHKLWDHIQIMSGFQLDVDSPYPLPEPETIQSKPDSVDYPEYDIKYGHYGKILERLIDKASAMEDGEEKDAFTKSIADLMKRHYVAYNRRTVEDDLIRKQLVELSDGKLKVPDDYELVSANDVVKLMGTVKNTASNKGKKGPMKKKKKR